MDEYARNFKRDGVNSNRDLLWFAKVEDHRYYSHRDEEVKQGIKKRGDRKEGLQRHIQVIVSRKDITGRYKLSPMNSSRGRNVEHSKKMGQFDRVAFKQSGETVFDREFGFDRGLKELFAHANVQKNGDIDQRQQMDILIDSEKGTELDRSFINDLANEVSKDTYDNPADLLEVIAKGIGGLLGTLLEPCPPGINIVPEQEPRKKKKRKRKNYGR